jgi:N-acetylglucosamine kinase-like BadF-type ATPase
MTSYYLGADVGATKTHVLIADEVGQVVGLGQSGPGNHETVGYGGLTAALSSASRLALAGAGLQASEIAGAGFGVAGYDWPSELDPTRRAILDAGLTMPMKIVNDTILGLLAGATEGWGVAVVSGTGCNCWGWDKGHRREGRVIGRSALVGEGAGGTELVAKAMEAVAHEWTQRGPATRLTPTFIGYAGARSLADLLEGFCEGHYAVDAAAAPLVFEVAATGDLVASQIIRWAGEALAELAKAVIRQLQFEGLEFEVVLVGGMYAGGSLLIDPMRRSVQRVASGARFVRLTTLPVAGAVLLGMEAAGQLPPSMCRGNLSCHLERVAQVPSGALA